ncbi:hypothetical protein [Streptomyces sp. TP-A0874]|uniref:hypothetical protein n=1 Tax=Streptomyces sp. TP-A0874 TaxID=549819 RepID=UPI0009A081E9|nr:hypothetical protein [Streptomyces sp. TP-A0874]
MLHSIAHLFEPLLRLLWPSPGRHRLPATRPAPAPAPAPARALAPSMPTHPLVRRRPPETLPPEMLPSGETGSLAHPYFLAHERQTAAYRRRSRPGVLWIAGYGIDIGPHLIHGIHGTEMAA